MHNEVAVTQGMNADLTDLVALGIWLHIQWWPQPEAASSAPALKTWQTLVLAETCACTTTAQCNVKSVQHSGIMQYYIDCNNKGRTAAM